MLAVEKFRDSAENCMKGQCDSDCVYLSLFHALFRLILGFKF